jgi:hypothetical protein
MAQKHKCFISYDSRDQRAVDRFIEQFSGSAGSFIAKHSDMDQDIVDSKNTDYVMSRIRARFLEDSTVTIVLVGKCTWSRRYVDWEVQSSLRKPADGPPPSGLVAIQLYESYSRLPDRVRANKESGYSEFYEYPKSSTSLANIIEEAFGRRRTAANKIVNSRDRFKYNKKCD